jgi:hypothetical protein
MHSGDEFVNQVRQLTEMLNKKAATGENLDPLYRVDFSCEVTQMPEAKETTAPVRVTVLAVYSSGHGEESAHLLNRSVSFCVTGTMITNIVFINGTYEEEENIPMNGTAEMDFLCLSKKFFSGLLPSPRISSNDC